ncbi:MAG: SUMF1/EgtB/PvdO family nonheme iron enzyme [Deltaproteobacteria bacterium]|nr:SUMF1/EgtB/PvdO family nonheme iron enzyme [Deltaproteobacteria bacterium]
MRLPSALALLVIAAGTSGATGVGDAGGDEPPPAPAGRVVTIKAAKRLTVHVPAGRFQMGFDERTPTELKQQCELNFETDSHFVRTGSIEFCDIYKQEADKMIARAVFVGEFDIDRLEVSVDEYRDCVAAGACQLDPLIAGDERYIRGEWPMVNATWYEAQDFCRWRGGRLPTEAEWERAARGADERFVWPWGEIEMPRDMNHGQPRAPALRELERDRNPASPQLQFFGDPDASDGHAILAPPGSYPWGESPFGTRDQAGNVAEWTLDAWVWKQDERGYQNLANINPYREGVSFDARVVRGGSWRQPTFIARANVRDPFNMLYQPAGRFSHVGFRCVRNGPTLADTRIAPADPPPLPPMPRRRRMP